MDKTKSEENLKTQENTVPEDFIPPDVSFKDIIFIPFKETIKYGFLLINYLSLIIYLYVLGYSTHLGDYHLIIVVTEVLYTLHTLLLILHRLMKTHRKKRYYQPASMIIIVIDVLVVLPLGEVMRLLQRFTWLHLSYLEQAEQAKYYVKLLRCVRIVLFFKEYRSNLKLNRKIVLPLIHFTISTLFASVMALAYYRYSCFGCGIPNWTNTLEEFKFDSQYTLNWAFICYFCSYTLQLQNANGLFLNMTSEEYTIAAISLLVGYVMQFMYLTGSLISEYIQTMKFKFHFERKVLNVCTFMDAFGMSKDVQKDVRVYYEEVWNRRKGLIQMPGSFALFPPQLQMEIKTDIYWEAILHTHIFSLFDMSFKKELSSIMTTEMLLPGQDFYTIGSVRSKMVYLVSGILEVMTPENLISPIMSLSSGTVLGETACIVPTVSSAKVRSATICELHILEHQRLTELMKKYSYLQKTLKRIWLRRIWFAKLKMENLSKSKDSMSHIFWIKTQWMRLLKLGLGEQLDESQIYNNYHTSRFLDLLVLSTEDELKVGSICIKGSCSFVLQPSSTLRHYWDYISLVTIILQVFGTAHMTFYHGYISDAAFLLTTTLDLFYILDAYIQGITAVTVHGVLISKPGEIFLHRTKQLTFLVDVIAAFPFDHIASFFKQKPYIIAIFRIPKFFKIYKVFLFIIAKQSLLSAKVITSQLVRYVSQHSMVLVVMVGFMYMSNCMNGICKVSGWLTHSAATESIQINPFLKTIYHTTSIYFSMCVSKIYPIDISDMIVHLIIYIVGYYMCAFSFVRTCASFALSNIEDFLYSLKIEKMETMINESAKLLPLKHTIMDFTKHQHLEIKSLTIEDVPMIMGQPSDYLQKIIRKEFLTKILERVTIFKGCSQEILEKLANTMRVYSVPEDHLIVQSGNRCFHLYVVIKGSASCKSFAPGDYERKQCKILKQYELFPLIGVIHHVASFLDVRTITACQVACISYLKMNRIINAHPIELMTFTQVLGEQKKNHGNLIGRNPLAYMRERVQAESQGTADSFQYEILEESLTIDRNIGYISLAKKYRKFCFALFYKTFDPNGKLVLGYEIFRSVLVLLHVIHIQLSILPIFLELFYTDFIFLVTLVQYLNFLDFYFRAHYQYYNHLGIKVTHPLWTCKHYFLTAFLVDFIGNFPIQILQLHVIVAPRHAKLSNTLFILLTRLFLLFRPYKLINYLQELFPIKLQFLCKIVKVSVYGLLVVGHIACFEVLFDCPITEDLTYDCQGNSWLTHARKNYSDNNLLFISFYSTITLTSLTGFKIFTNTDYLIKLIKALFVFFFKMLYFARIIGNSVLENSKLSKYQDGINHYIEFTKAKILSNSDTLELLQHYKNFWKKSKGEIPLVVFDSLYPLLKNRVCFAMYTPTLKLSPIWNDTDKSFLNLLATYLVEHHFKKGAEIIRCNDIQDKVFFVYKGSVDVEIAGMQLETLEPGGVFGCFEKTGFTRQTISVTARVHICVLCIRAIKLYEIARIFPSVTNAFHKLQFEKKEYVPISDSPRQSTTVSIAHHSLKEQPYHFFERTFDETKRYYIVWNYLASVHVAALSSLLCLFLMVLDTFLIIPLWIVLDLYYLFHIYLKTHATYTDLDSGLTVTHFFSILRKYSRSFMLYVDVFSILPIYLFSYIDHGEILDGYYLTNKLLRIVYLWNYYWQHVLRKNVPRHIRWAFVLYMTMFLLQLIFNLWWLVDNASTISYSSVSATYLHVVNVFTNAGLYEDILMTFINLVMNLILLAVSHFLSIYLLIVVSRMQLVQNNHIAGYKQRTELVVSYCRQLQASHYIIEKGWHYLIYLYRKLQGEQIPRLLKDAPPYIKQDHMRTLFGKEFERHFIFYNAHKDFLRQMYMYINLCIYLPDDLIVESGDVNGTLYFIEEGSVMSIEKLSDTHIFENLSEGEWFGEVQGILNFPYEKTYRAVTVCSIMSLRKSDWGYLLEWFPATEEALYELAHICHDAR